MTGDQGDACSAHVLQCGTAMKETQRNVHAGRAKRYSTSGKGRGMLWRWFAMHSGQTGRGLRQGLVRFKCSRCTSGSQWAAGRSLRGLHHSFFSPPLCTAAALSQGWHSSCPADWAQGQHIWLPSADCNCPLMRGAAGAAEGGSQECQVLP